MSVCNTCRTKGNCCKGFVLSFYINKGDNYEKELATRLSVNKLEFLIPRRAPYYDTEYTLGFQFDCSLLGNDGLCSDYENRPDMCRAYRPKQDPLCCEYVQNIKGIPIVAC